MTLVAVVLAAGAALLHVDIWVLESFRWTEPTTRRTFGVSEADARVLESMAFNQGFYNLFLTRARVRMTQEPEPPVSVIRRQTDGCGFV